MTALKRAIVPIAKLAVAAYNPRRMSARALKGLRASMEQFGMVQDIVVNRRNMRVVGGQEAELREESEHVVEIWWQPNKFYGPFGDHKERFRTSIKELVDLARRVEREKIKRETQGAMKEPT